MPNSAKAAKCQGDVETATAEMHSEPAIITVAMRFAGSGIVRVRRHSWISGPNAGLESSQP